MQHPSPKKIKAHQPPTKVCPQIPLNIGDIEHFCAHIGILRKNARFPSFNIQYDVLYNFDITIINR